MIAEADKCSRRHVPWVGFPLAAMLACFKPTSRAMRLESCSRGAARICGTFLAVVILMVTGLSVRAALAAPARLQLVTVTATRLKLLGHAVTASQGVVSKTELVLLPAYRPAQLVETVPGLAATVHSGEGKASQYLMRGYNLDHGTDCAFFVDDMPANEPTHAHGQGYSDLNFLIPELVSGVSYAKGTYYADEGDFASVGSAHISYDNTTADQVKLSAGMRASGGSLLPARSHSATAICSQLSTCSTTMAHGSRPTISAKRAPCCVTAGATKRTDSRSPGCSTMTCGTPRRISHTRRWRRA